MKQLTVVAKIKAIAGKEKALKEALVALIPITLKEEGCINYNLHVSAENDSVFLFYENWKSHELWQNHMNNDHVKTFIAKMPEIVDGDIDLSTWHIN